MRMLSTAIHNNNFGGHSAHVTTDNNGDDTTPTNSIIQQQQKQQQQQSPSYSLSYSPDHDCMNKIDVSLRETCAASVATDIKDDNYNPLYDFTRNYNGVLYSDISNPRKGRHILHFFKGKQN